MTLEKYDLLWQYYVRTSRYANASAVLAELAEADMYVLISKIIDEKLIRSRSFPLSLHKRVEYLSLAVSNAKSQLPSAASAASVASLGVEFLTEIEEKLEVAMVQIEIFRAVEELSRIGRDMERDEDKATWLEKLEDKLYTISEVSRFSNESLFDTQR